MKKFVLLSVLLSFCTTLVVGTIVIFETLYKGGYIISSYVAGCGFFLLFLKVSDEVVEKINQMIDDDDNI